MSDGRHRLEEILLEMKDLTEEARRIVRRQGGVTYERARGYWLAQLDTALDRDHDYLGGCMFTMADTIEEMPEDGDDEDDSEDQEEDVCVRCGKQFTIGAEGDEGVCLGCRGLEK